MGPRARRGWAAVFTLLSAAVPYSSESAPARRTARTSAPADGADVSLGYSFLRAGEASLDGWLLSGSFPVRPSVRLAAEIGGHYGAFAGARLRQISFLAGPRVVGHAGGRLRPFGQALVGGSHTTSRFEAASLSAGDTAWGGALGIGTDYRVARRWALRGQADYLLLHSGGGWDADPRLSLGAAYRFGR
jgi:hypothetical protein